MLAGPQRLRRSVCRPSIRREQLRRLRHHLRRRHHLLAGRVRVPAGSDHLRRRLRRSTEEQRPLRRVRDSLRRRQGLFAGDVYQHLFGRVDRVLWRLRRPRLGRTELRRVQQGVRGGGDLRRRRVRLPRRSQQVWRRLRGSSERSQELRPVCGDVHRRDVVRAGQMPDGLRGWTDLLPWSLCQPRVGRHQLWHLRCAVHGRRDLCRRHLPLPTRSHPVCGSLRRHQQQHRPLRHLRQRLPGRAGL